MILLYLLICLLIAGFFAGMETGLVTADPLLATENRAFQYLTSKPDRLLGTTLIGYNIANVTAAVLLTNYMDQIGWERFIWLGILCMTFVFLILNDIIPKSFFRKNANTLAVRLSPILVFCHFLFLPVYFVLNTLVKIILIVSGHHTSKREELRSRRDIRFMINIAGREEGLSGSDQQLIEDILIAKLTRLPQLSNLLF